jgi:site-specific DNA recombinase
MIPPNPPIKYLIYARKSTESEDRQVASIDSQIKELKAIAKRDGLDIVDTHSESKSAKAPGRPVFSDLLTRIHHSKANGILCWKLDRLARNPVDGGNISWMLQQGVIQHIQTHERGYFPTDNVLMMAVELGMANQFIRDLSQNVKRGLLAKVEKGWFPGVAKAGYQNDPISRQGEKTIRKDPIRLPLLKRALQLVLAETHTPMQALDKLNNEWGYQTLKKRKMGGRPLARSIFYDILTDPFYYGRFEFPKGSGRWYQGRHEPMITEDEFWHIQRLLGRDGRPRRRVHSFPFTGLIHCGECSCIITAEDKEQVICSECKLKFSSKNRNDCPVCSIAISQMKSPKHLHYTYYHCTKKRTPCSQRSIRNTLLEEQITQTLETISISDRLKGWYMDQLNQQAEHDAKDKAPILESLQQARDNSQKRLDNLLKLKISPQNSAGELLDDEEFANQKTAISTEMIRLEAKMASTEKDAAHWINPCEKTFNFACYATDHFKNGTPETKRAILTALGSNLTLQDKKLRISLHKHFQLMQLIRAPSPAQNPQFEPKISPQPKRKNRALNPASPCWLGDKDTIRTYFLQTGESIFIPELKPL